MILNNAPQSYLENLYEWSEDATGVALLHAPHWS